MMMISEKINSREPFLLVPWWSYEGNEMSITWIQRQYNSIDARIRQHVLEGQFIRLVFILGESLLGTADLMKMTRWKLVETNRYSRGAPKFLKLRFDQCSEQCRIYSTGWASSPPFALFVATPSSTSLQNSINAGKTVSFQYVSLRLTRTMA